MTRLIHIAILICIMTACLNSKDKELKTVIKYIGDSGYRPDSIHDLRDSTIVFAFISSFDNDSVEIKTDSTSKKLLLITEPITGHAETVVLGKMKNHQEIALKLNNNKPIKIKTNLDNQIFVIKYYHDSLFVESVYHLPSFR